jgi:hypothetical protein
VAIAFFATLQSQSLAVGATVATAALFLFLIARRLPDLSVRPTLEPSPLLTGAVLVAVPQAASLSNLRAHVPQPTPVRTPSRLAPLHAAVVAAAPPVRSASIAPSGRFERLVSGTRLGGAARSVLVAVPQAVSPSMLRAHAPRPTPVRTPARLAPLHGAIVAAAQPVRSASIALSVRLERLVTGLPLDAAGRSVLAMVPDAVSPGKLRAHVPRPTPVRTPAKLAPLHAAIVASAPPARSASIALRGPVERLVSVTRARAAAALARVSRLRRFRL